jgi:hypothetical protein
MRFLVQDESIQTQLGFYVHCTTPCTETVALFSAFL